MSQLSQFVDKLEENFNKHIKQLSDLRFLKAKTELTQIDTDKTIPELYKLLEKNQENIRQTRYDKSCYYYNNIEPLESKYKLIIAKYEYSCRYTIIQKRLFKKLKRESLSEFSKKLDLLSKENLHLKKLLRANRLLQISTRKSMDIINDKLLKITNLIDKP